jgi:hypothetical protein
MAQGRTPEYEAALVRYMTRFGQPVYFSLGSPSIPDEDELIGMMDQAVMVGKPLGLIGGPAEPPPAAAPAPAPQPDPA